MATVRDLMTPDPVTLGGTEPVTTAARAMRDQDVGAVLVADDATLRGIVTDRDLAIRLIADGEDPESTTVGSLCSTDLHTLSPDDPLDAAVRMMSEHALRRVPVVENQVPVGILSLGDLAVTRDPDSVLADVSAAAPNN